MSAGSMSTTSKNSPLESLPVALVGSPNSGKTTLFNWLTGSRFRAVNYPGSTVDCYRGQTLSVYGDGIEVIDTPGTYSLLPRSPDEQITVDVLWGRYGSALPVVIAVVDATQIDRQLYLVKQLQAAGFKPVVALTMMDLANKAHMKIQVDELQNRLGVAVIPVDGRLGGGIKDLLTSVRQILAQEKIRGFGTFVPQSLDWNESRINQEMKLAAALATAIVPQRPKGSVTWALDGAWDRWLLHPFWGLVFFMLVMTALFSSIFWAAQPLMDLVDGFFSWSAYSVEKNVGGLVGDFLANGLLTSLGAVLVFVPQIFILFLGLSVLEDTGYLARAATMVDRPFQALGLSGRSFVPMLSGFACAVPAMMATRNIRSLRERTIMLFILPFMTCSARLPVYALLLGFLFLGKPAWYAGLAMALLYFLSILLGTAAAALLNWVMPSKSDSSFMLELPIYRQPKWRVVLRTSWLRTNNYIRRAGPVIFVLAIILWVATQFPKSQDPNLQLAESYAGQLGQKIEVVFKPMGLDWRAGVGLMAAFAAREVFVSSLAVILNVVDDESIQENMLVRMREAVLADGTPLFTIASVMGLVVFFMIALQCLSTTAMAYRESGRWRFALIQLVSMNILAYAAATGVVQGLRAVGIQ